MFPRPGRPSKPWRAENGALDRSEVLTCWWWGGDHLQVSIRGSLRRSLTARELAGDARAGSWARQRAWREQRAFIRSRWQALVVGWAVLASPALLFWFFVSPFFQGLFLGGSVVGASAVVWSVVVQSTGTASRVMGSQAEQWTAQEVRGLRRRGWRVVNHLELARDGDIDHVLVGPAGIVVLETKWSSRSWLEPSVGERTADARRQVRRGATRVQSWARSWTDGASVCPAVVLWGGDLRRTTAGGVMQCPEEGVTVLSGHRLRAWLGGLPVDPAFDLSMIDHVWREIAAHVEKRDGRNRATSPRLRTPQEWMLRCGLGAVFLVLVLGGLVVGLTVADT